MGWIVLADERDGHDLRAGLAEDACELVLRTVRSAAACRRTAISDD
jgi:hypothetical protein